MSESVRPFPGRSEPPGPPPEHFASATLQERAPVSLRLGGWLFEPSLNRLSRGDTEVRLEPQVAKLLSFLASHPGRVVSKDEIIEAVWEGRFVADSALTRTMAELRRALGDDAHAPTFIETISKKGYRLLVEPTAAGEESVRSGRRSALAALAIALPLLAAALVYALVVQRVPRETALPATVSAVVVLPLEDLSPESEGEYFAASMTEALTTDLARLGAFRVLSRRSVEQYQEEMGSLRGIAAGLGADAAVEGTVVRSGGRVRINVQLTDAASETHLWAASYERDFVDVLALQREVARAIAEELESSASAGFGERRAAPADDPQVDPAALDLYLKGRHALKRAHWEGANGAAEQFERALAIDPGFAPAHASLAEYYAKLTLFDFLKPYDGFPKARAAAQRALEIDPELAEAHTALAWVEFLFDWDWEDAEAGYRRALELNPSHARARKAYSFFLTCMGRFAEAEEQARREREIDPLIGVGHLAWVLFNAGRFEESLALFETHVAGESSGPGSDVAAWSHALLGNYDEAVSTLEELVAHRGGDDTVNLGVLGWTYARSGRPREAHRVLARLEELTDGQTRGDLYPQVLVQAGLGDTERALDLLEQAALQRSPNAVFIGVEPFLAQLREAPRFRRLLASTRLAGAAADPQNAP